MSASLGEAAVPPTPGAPPALPALPVLPAPAVLRALGALVVLTALPALGVLAGVLRATYMAPQCTGTTRSQDTVVLRWAITGIIGLQRTGAE